MTLAEKNAEARRLGLSYGQYIAKYHPANVPEPQPQPKPGPKPTIVQCVVCGNPLPKLRKRFCSDYCGHKYWRNRTSSVKRKAVDDG